ncbi:MAG: GDSL-type esterase/lipase family protein [Fibrobacterota bacterium]
MAIRPQRTLFFLSFLWLLMQCDSLSPTLPPDAVEGMPDTTVAVNDSIRLWIHPPENVYARTEYLWSLDGGQTFRDTTTETFLDTRWQISDSGNHKIVVIALDDNRRKSQADTIRIRVNPFRPSVHLSCPDSQISINDTIVFSASSRDTNGTITAYRWQIDSLEPIISDSNRIEAVWARAAEGLHTVLVWARDDDSLWSDPDSMTIRVTAFAPILASVSDTQTCIMDTCTFIAQASDSDGTIVTYTWAKNDSVIQSVNDSLLETIFTINDTGIQSISVYALDEDSLSSDTIDFQVFVQPCPPELSLPHDTVIYLHDSLTIIASTHQNNGSVSLISWSYDNTSWVNFTPETPMSFTAQDTAPTVLYAKAVDIHGAVSEVDSMRIDVLRGYPIVEAADSITGYIHNKSVLYARATDHNGFVEEYQWYINDTKTPLDIQDSVLTRTWTRSDTGMKKIMVRVRDNDSLWSTFDTIHVHIKSHIPVVAISRQFAEIFVNDTLTLAAENTETDSDSIHYVWQIDNSELISVQDSISLAWNADETGEHIVKVWAVSQQRAYSLPESCTVQVDSGTPRIQIPQDTILPIGDTLLIIPQAQDTNGSIAAVTYQIDGGTERYLNRVPFPFSHNSIDTVKIRFSAIDDDGLVASDALTIHVYDPQRNLVMHSPGDTIWVRKDVDGGVIRAVSFTYGPQFPGVFSSSPTYDLYLDKNDLRSTPVYTGTDTAFVTEISDTGQYQWRLEANRMEKDSASIEGTIISAYQKTICFAGHSIAVGVGGNGFDGGYRRSILDSLRSNQPEYASLAALGPESTAYMQQFPQDDSCLAISGKMAVEIYHLLGRNPSLTADIWVLMIGVNGNYYSVREPYFTPILVDMMHNRNPQGHIFVLNGIQIPDTIYEMDTIVCADSIDSRRQRLYDFNNTLEEAIALRQDEGKNVYLVDAFSTLSPDSLFHHEYMADYLHPNQSGYQILAEAILRCMSENGIYSP